MVSKKMIFRIIYVILVLSSSGFLFSQNRTGSTTGQSGLSSQSNQSSQSGAGGQGSLGSQRQGELEDLSDLSDVRSETAASLLGPNPQLALSVPDYRVTAGDIYTLTFAAGSQAVQYVIPVDTTYRIRVANLGIADASGKTFAQLKTQVEAIVTNNYPLSGVQFVLTKPAVFKVQIKGEVKTAQELEAWALTRLSAIAVKKNLTEFASLRDVTIKSSGGQSRTYDLFRAARFGEKDEDPYLRPGDEITFNRAERIITVEGAVERPAVYQLMPGENLKELVEIYAGGFAPEADREALELIRLVNSADRAGNMFSLSERDVAANFALENHDTLTVPDITEFEPVMFIEGAVGIPRETEDQLVSSTRIMVRFFKGENYSSLIRRNMDWFTAVSDTLNAYIIRGEKQIAFNLNPILYDPEYRSEFFVENNDILIIPFRQYFVNVAGAVAVPGRYQYIPDRQWDYYISLAGGFNPDQNSRKAIDITDVNGKKLSKADFITPESIINARVNSFAYHFNQYAPVITTTLTIVSTFISVYLLINR